MSVNGIEKTEGEKAAQLSLILGILGLFTVGIILGPIALVQAKKAERMGVSATGGKVTGWIATIGGIISIIFAIFMVIAMVSAGVSGASM